MKLFRFGQAGEERPGILDADGGYRDLSGVIDDVWGGVLAGSTLTRLKAVDPLSLPRVDPEVRIGPCTSHIGNLLGIGLNYADHAAEAKLPIPKCPVIFSKATSCIAGPNDPLVLPLNSQQVDYEVELAAVLCRDAWQVREDDAMHCVGGYCLSNDFTDRYWQSAYAGQWTMAKSAPGFGRLGPWLVTPDELPDVGGISLELRVNGEVKQHATTSGLIFKLPRLIAYISSFFRLCAGDVITTGTPAGVGLATGVYLNAGDQIDAAAGLLGRHMISVVEASQPLAASC